MMIDGEVVSETTSAERITHAKRLMPMIDILVKRAGVKLTAFDGFAATIGPGSFTGLRIGISTLKGLSAATGKPIVGISSLDALAHQCPGETELVSPMLDARKEQVYYCRYRRTPAGVTALVKEDNAAPAEAVAGIVSSCTFIGDGALAYREVITSVLGAKAVFAPEANHIISARTVAELALKRLIAGSADDPINIAPHYIRKSDAETASAPP